MGGYILKTTTELNYSVTGSRHPSNDIWCSTLLFIHSSADLYGSDITLLQIVSGLDRDRFKAIVVVPYEGPLVPYLREAGAEVLVYPRLPIIRRQHMNVAGLFRLATSFLATARWISGVVRQREVVLIHNTTLAVSLAGLAAKAAKRPQISHVQEIIAQPRIVAALLATLSSAISTLVVANSQATAEHFCRTRFDPSAAPIRVIPNGVDESRLSYYEETKLRSLVSAGPQEVVFTLAGRINRLKGHSVFFDAAERLAAEFGRARFLIVGDSFAGQERLSEEVDHRIESSELLRGRMTRLPHVAEVGSVYAASDVIVMPSTEPESFGLVAAEAMAVGLPVIASRIGALPEVVDHGRTGILVDPGDATSLLEAMRTLSFSPSLRAEMGREGRMRFERYYRIDGYTKEFNRTYDDLLRKARYMMAS
jgi:glycosyltransferase involved in cell wall biosynthesis